jgi:hypothetical protein
MKRGVIATYRPQADEVALFVDDGESSSAAVLSVPEARAIHGALDLALRLASCRAEPLRAVDGGMG